MTPVHQTSRAALLLLLLLALLSVTVAAVMTAPAASARYVAGEIQPTGPIAGLSNRATTRSAPTRGVWPLRPPQVLREFDPPAVTWGAGHRGADLAGQVGQPVRAALAGRISFVGRIAGRGVVVVDHGATRTTYEPVLATTRHGQQVSAGDVIGRLAAVGSHCAPRACLHWGLRRGKSYLDPLTLVDAPKPVRLLPW